MENLDQTEDSKEGKELNSNNKVDPDDTQEESRESLSENSQLIKDEKKTKDWVIPLRDLNEFEDDDNVLGKGQFGQVYKGFYKETVPVAIKTAIVQNSEEFQKFLDDLNREAELMSIIEVHPNVLKFIGVVEEKDKILVVLELCDRGALEKYYKKKNEMTEELAIHFAFGIACGLQSLHDKDVIHGDLAPRNILLNGEELIPKICDFGFSRKIKDFPLSETPEKNPIPIMSPQDLKAKGKVRTKRGDVWAYGIIIWQMYSRETPYHDYEGDNLVSDVMQGKIFPGNTEDIKNEKLKEIVTNCWSSTEITSKDIVQELDDLK